MENQNQDMQRIMGVGPEIQTSELFTKTLRVGTIKLLEDVGTLYKDGLIRIKSAIFNKDEEQINKWVEILDVVFVDGFSREEFDESIPELMEDAVHRFLFD